MNLQVILGNQLFPKKYFSDDPVFMCEDYELCTHFEYHKIKIIFFLTAMREFADQFEHTHYFQLDGKPHFFNQLLKTVKKLKIKKLIIYEVEDKFFEKKIKEFAVENKLELTIKDSPLFICKRETFKKYLDSTKRPFMKSFYEKLRVDLKIMMEGDNPEGGKFSFDSENRKKIPKKFDVIQNDPVKVESKHLSEVKALVDQLFSKHPGKSEDYWIPVTRAQSLKVLKEFTQKKFAFFGDYQDAIDTRDPFLYHSIISPMLNAGLILPQEVIKAALKADVPMNAKEGFIRQVLGWREFMRGIYQNYDEVQQERNFFNHQNKLASCWYDGTTGIEPVDDVIKKINKYAYGHHIERLMLLSNLMLLCRVHPQEVYCYFMIFFADSSDWVMGPNVFGMGQFSDGGIFATKPYFSGSNYVIKMSHYIKGEWSEIWDALYWSFIGDNIDFFKKNYRLSMMASKWSKFNKSKQQTFQSRAQDFIQNVTY